MSALKYISKKLWADFGVPFRINVYVEVHRCEGRVVAGGCADPSSNSVQNSFQCGFQPSQPESRSFLNYVIYTVAENFLGILNGVRIVLFFLPGCFCKVSSKTCDIWFFVCFGRI